nr:type II toxin-antitoxin system VapC family toxin [Agrococcus sp. ARC_14]
MVDTSVWIDHLHRPEPGLVGLLEDDAVSCHPLVIQELALGSIARRETLLRLLESLHAMPTLSHRELLSLIDARRLWGRGLSAVDVHLLGAVALVDGARLWTRDKRLLAACREVGIGVLQDPR